MRYQRLGRTDLQVSALALGTVELGMDYGIPIPGRYGRPPEDEAIRLVHAALDAGINLIDTARSYGQSEHILGQVVRLRRQEMVLATKVRTQSDDGTTPTGQDLRKRMFDSLEESLRQLQTDWVDIWQIHFLDQALIAQLDLVTEVFDEAQRMGKVRWVGASTYGVDIPLAAVLSDRFDVVQITYSILDQRLADNVLPLARARDIGIIARSVLLQGVLTERGDYLPERLDRLRARSRQFRALVAESNIDLSPAQTAIAFVLTHPQISTVLVGVRSQEELSEDLRSMAATLPDGLLDRLYSLRLDDPELLNPATWHLSS